MKRLKRKHLINPLFNFNEKLEETPVRSNWGSEVEKERRNRILVAVAAYAYEFMSNEIMSDPKYDKLARKINLKQTTKNPKMDAWFQKHFRPNTGMWVYRHPNKARLRQIATNLLAEKGKS